MRPRRKAGLVALVAAGVVALGARGGRAPKPAWPVAPSPATDAGPVDRALPDVRGEHLIGGLKVRSEGERRLRLFDAGGVVAGVISDRVFGSRRGPVAGVLYGVLAVGGLVMAATITNVYALGATVIVMMLAVIGVHGMLSGAASMDFGGKKNVGIVVGIIDGFVYLGTGAQAFYYASALPTGAAAKSAAAWKVWPGAMVPVAVLGLALCATIWNARPSKGGAGGH